MQFLRRSFVLFFSLIFVVACSLSDEDEILESSTPTATHIHLRAPTATCTPTCKVISQTITPNETNCTPSPSDTITPLVECIGYDPASLQIAKLDDEAWELTFGYIRIALLDNVADAHTALELAKQYSQRCFIGMTYSERYFMQYWKGESSVTGEERDWDCVSFNPENLKIVADSNLWTIMGDEELELQSFESKVAAEMGLEIAQQHSKVCYIGRGNQRENRWEYIISYWK
jgi:hypothetical protein